METNRKKILIVEDEDVSRKILTLALEGKRYELIFAGDGENAVEIARQQHPDLIVMDIMLPRVNGFEATRAIRSSPGLEDVPVIALTARTTVYDEKAAREAGCSDFITKPFRIGELRTRIMRLLSAAGGEQAD
jgi:DNA-binding response OmpR family regulator